MRLSALALLVAIWLCPLPAAAFFLGVDGQVATLRGRFDPGDAARFKAMLDGAKANPIRILYLDSAGGSIDDGIAIGRMVRAAGIVTATDATGASCESACTLVFVAGVRRHYINGDKIFEGLSAVSGLGFHTAHFRGNAVRPSLKSESGTNLMRQFYAEMGAPGASALMAKAAFNTLYRPNGKTALELRIATSLARP